MSTNVPRRWPSVRHRRAGIEPDAMGAREEGLSKTVVAVASGTTITPHRGGIRTDAWSRGVLAVQADCGLHHGATVDERDQRDRRAQNRRRQASHPVEGLLGRGVEDRVRAKRLEACRLVLGGFCWEHDRLSGARREVPRR